MSDQVNKATDDAKKIFTATQEALDNDWDQKENLQFPVLFKHVMVRVKADPKAATEIDLFMRSYVRNHPSYYVSRGAKGGIMLRSVADARNAKKAEIEAAKKVLIAQVDAKVAAQAASVSDEKVEQVNE